MDQELELKISKSLEHIESMLSDEIDVHPDTLYKDAGAFQQLQLGPASMPFIAYWTVSTREGSRYLTLQLRDGLGNIAIYRTWRCSYQDWTQGGKVIDKASK